MPRIRPFNTRYRRILRFTALESRRMLSADSFGEIDLENDDEFDASHAEFSSSDGEDDFEEDDFDDDDFELDEDSELAFRPISSTSIAPSQDSTFSNFSTPENVENQSGNLQNDGSNPTLTLSEPTEAEAEDSPDEAAVAEPEQVNELSGTEETEDAEPAETSADIRITGENANGQETVDLALAALDEPIDFLFNEPSAEEIAAGTNASEFTYTEEARTIYLFRTSSSTSELLGAQSSYSVNGGKDLTSSRSSKEHNAAPEETPAFSWLGSFADDIAVVDEAFRRWVLEGQEVAEEALFALHDAKNWAYVGLAALSYYFVQERYCSDRRKDNSQAIFQSRHYPELFGGK